MKKFLSVLLSLVLIIFICSIGLFNITASAATSGTTGDCTWSLDGTTLTIGGKGYMRGYDYENNMTPWGNSVTNIIVEYDVLSIGRAAFYNCTSLTNVTIPDSVKSIGEAAFFGCSSITSVMIPNLQGWGDEMFFGCSNLKEITFGSGITIIPSGVFTEGCHSIEKIFLPKEISEIHRNAFKDSKNITDIYYEGTQEAWQNVLILNNNGSLSDAIVHYNCTSLPKHDKDIIESNIEKDENAFNSSFLTKAENCKATGHKMGKSVVTLEPTCTAEGKKEGTCTVCGTKAEETIAAKGHTFGEAVVTKEATEIETGIKTKTCTVCNATEEEEIPYLTAKPETPEDEKTDATVDTDDKDGGNNMLWIIIAIVSFVLIAGVVVTVVLIKKKKSSVIE